MRYFIIALVLLLASCTTRYIPVESTKIDSVFVAKIQRDSIYERDSIMIKTKADTVYYTRIAYKYRDRILRDTVFEVHTDTITNVVEVERKLSTAEKVMWLAEKVFWLVVGIVLLVAFKRLLN